MWADWSQHLTTAASFASGGNIPPVNPLFSGTTLLYPFLPDFHAATLMTLGLAPGLALAIPGGVLVMVIALLVVALGRRLGLGIGAGVVAVLICFIGGGLGFIGAFLRRVHEPRIHRNPVHVAVRRHPSRHWSVDRRVDAARPSRHASSRSTVPTTGYRPTAARHRCPTCSGTRRSWRGGCRSARCSSGSPPRSRCSCSCSPVRRRTVRAGSRSRWPEC